MLTYREICSFLMKYEIKIHKKITDSQTIGWNSIGSATWLILNASSKRTYLSSIKTKFYEEWVLKLN